MSGECPRCGAARPAAEARFCMVCGVRLAEAPEPSPGELRFVTVVFCDVMGSTELAARLSPDVWSSILSRYFTAATAALSEAGGRVEKFIGDAVVAVFGAETAGEDDGVRAVRAACAIRDQVRAEGARLQASRGITFAVRLGVASGRVALSPDRDSSFAIGAVLNRAARLQGAAGQDEVVVDARTWLLSRSSVTTTPIGTVAAKGFHGGVRAWRVDSGAVPQVSVPDELFVGRADLVLALGGHLRTGLDGELPAVALVEGEVGIGKSRLIDRCWRDLSGRADRLVLRCAQDGTHLGLRSLFALADALAQLEGQPPAEGRSPSRPLAEIHWEIHSRLLAAARRRPLLLVVEDAHWASPALLELLPSLVALPLPSFALVLSGRELPDLPAFGDAARRFPVPPLDAADSRRLIGAASGGIELHSMDVQEQMISRSGGNPLYLSQLLTLAEESDTHPDLFPPSAEAVVGARVDRLALDARHLLATIAAFGGGAAPADLASAATLLGLGVEEPLIELTEQQFVVSRPEVVECTMPMAAEVAYRRLTLADRASLHGHIAETLRARLSAEPPAIELVAHHAVTAHAAVHECDPGSEDERRAAARAAWALCDAARFAILHSATSPALRYLQLARDTGSGDPVVAMEVASIEAYALLAGGEPDRALSLAEQALNDTDPATHPAAAADLLLTAALTEKVLRGTHAPQRVQQARALAERSGDPAALSRSLLFQAFEATAAGRYPAAQSALLDAAALAAQATGCLSTAEIHGNLALCLTLGDQPAADALATCEELYRGAGQARTLAAAIGCPMGHLLHMVGRGEDALRVLAEARTVCEDIGHRAGLAGVYSYHATLAERDGDLPLAMQRLRQAIEVCAQSGLHDLARATRQRHDVLAVLTGAAPPQSPPPPAKSWWETMANSHLLALQQADVEPLRSAIRVLDEVRGSGAVIPALLTGLRVARHLDAVEVAADYSARLQAAARAKGDDRLLLVLDGDPARSS
ncbi:MAG: hypothetical protein AUG49_18050 [Catenulispora sp. 13_1_20CM_3_70_7]|nr:MAG: hypothetical protein AUG49_18050 [Catenulispora sp. 13_1_20CM_3_70_7]